MADSADRFWNSAEFAVVVRLLGGGIKGAVVLDLSAGTGIASYALARAGTRLVYTLEPDASDEVGRGDTRRPPPDMPIEVLPAGIARVRCSVGYNAASIFATVGYERHRFGTASD